MANQQQPARSASPAGPEGSEGTRGSGGRAGGGGGSAGGKGPLVCQVDNCGADLSREKTYHQRHKVCAVHMRALAVLLDGEECRWCQQCARFQSLDEFDATKRSCRVRLSEHNARRRHHRPAGAGEEGGDDAAGMSPSEPSQEMAAATGTAAPVPMADTPMGERPRRASVARSSSWGHGMGPGRAPLRNASITDTGSQPILASAASGPLATAEQAGSAPSQLWSAVSSGIPFLLTSGAAAAASGSLVGMAATPFMPGGSAKQPRRREDGGPSSMASLQLQDSTCLDRLQLSSGCVASPMATTHGGGAAADDEQDDAGVMDLEPMLLAEGGGSLNPNQHTLLLDDSRRMARSWPAATPPILPPQQQQQLQQQHVQQQRRGSMTGMPGMDSLAPTRTSSNGGMALSELGTGLSLLRQGSRKRTADQGPDSALVVGPAAPLMASSLPTNHPFLDAPPIRTLPGSPVTTSAPSRLHRVSMPGGRPAPPPSRTRMAFTPNLPMSQPMAPTLGVTSDGTATLGAMTTAASAPTDDPNLAGLASRWSLDVPGATIGHQPEVLALQAFLDKDEPFISEEEMQVAQSHALASSSRGSGPSMGATPFGDPAHHQRMTHLGLGGPPGNAAAPGATAMQGWVAADGGRNPIAGRLLHERPDSAFPRSAPLMMQHHGMPGGSTPRGSLLGAERGDASNPGSPMQVPQAQEQTLEQQRALTKCTSASMATNVALRAPRYANNPMLWGPAGSYGPSSAGSSNSTASKADSLRGLLTFDAGLLQGSGGMYPAAPALLPALAGASMPAMANAQTAMQYMPLLASNSATIPSPSGVPSETRNPILDAISWQMAQCKPEQLPPDLLTRLQAVVQTRDPVALQAMLRQADRNLGP